MLRRVARQEKQSWTHTGRIGTADPGLLWSGTRGAPRSVSTSRMQRLHSYYRTQLRSRHRRQCLRVRCSAACRIRAKATTATVRELRSCVAWYHHEPVKETILSVQPALIKWRSEDGCLRRRLWLSQRWQCLSRKNLVSAAPRHVCISIRLGN